MFILLGSLKSGFLDGDSLSYSLTARNVAQTNQWLSIYDPTYGGPFYYHFPLIIWILALGFKFFGVSVLSAAAFSLICAVFSVFSIYYLGRYIKNEWTGFFAAAVFILISYTPRLARQARMDMPLTLFIIIGLYFFLKAVQEKEKRKRGFLLFGFFCGLAIMAKDINGVAPLAIAFLYLIFTRRFRLLALYLVSAAISILPVVAWIMMEHKIYGSSLFERWLNWNFLHLLKDPSQNKPFFYYPYEIVKRYFFLVPLFISGAYFSIKNLISKKEDKSFLLVIWMVFIPLVFSFSERKAHYWVYSMYPAAAVLAGLALDRFLAKENAKLVAVRTLGVLTLVLFLAKTMFSFDYVKRQYSDEARVSEHLNSLNLAGPVKAGFFGVDSRPVIFYTKAAVEPLELKDNNALLDFLADTGKISRLCMVKRNIYDSFEKEFNDWSVSYELGDTLVLTKDLQ